MGPFAAAAAVRSKVEARKRRKKEKKAKVPTPAARASTVSDSDDSDDDATKAKKKKKAKVDAGDLRAVQAAPRRNCSTCRRGCGHRTSCSRPPCACSCRRASLATRGSAAVAALRRRLGVRVPDVRSRVCSFWLKGTCKRGEACAFAHSDSEVNLAGAAAPCPPPIDGLGHPALPRLIGRAMLHLGHREPSAVQAQAWSVALSGRDLLCRAPTGSGKTLAYVLPAFCHVLAQKKPPTPNAGPYVLVLVPTRELAMQVHGVCRGLRKLAGVESAALYGGAPREEQVSAVEAAVGLVVATTGGCSTCCSPSMWRWAASLSSSSTRPTPWSRSASRRRCHRSAASCAPTARRFSSPPHSPTPSSKLPPAGCARLSACTSTPRAATKSAAAAAPVEAVAALPATVTQSFLICDDGRRRESLRAFLESLPRGRNPARVMVFVNQIKTIKALAASLRKFGLACAALHGDLAQWEREESLQRFRAGAAPVLVTTDVGARGLDIRQLPAVVSFDVPASIEQYVHRAGRTGRQGAAGVALTLLRRDAASAAFARARSPLLQAGGVDVPAELAALASWYIRVKQRALL